MCVCYKEMIDVQLVASFHSNPPPPQPSSCFIFGCVSLLLRPLPPPISHFDLCDQDLSLSLSLSLSHTHTHTISTH